MTHRQALDAALVVLGRDHVLVAAGLWRGRACPHRCRSSASTAPGGCKVHRTGGQTARLGLLPDVGRARNTSRERGVIVEREALA